MKKNIIDVDFQFYPNRLPVTDGEICEVTLFATNNIAQDVTIESLKVTTGLDTSAWELVWSDNAATTIEWCPQGGIVVKGSASVKQIGESKKARLRNLGTPGNRPTQAIYEAKLTRVKVEISPVIVGKIEQNVITL